MNRTRRLARLVAMIVLTVPVLALTALGAARFVGYSTQIIATGSMEPEIGRGSVVLMRPLPAEDLRVGDVVLIPRPAHDGRSTAPVMHRVVSLRRDAGLTSVATKGDANPAPDADPYVVKTHTMTPVVVLPYLGFLLSELRTPRGWLLLAVLPAGIRSALVLRRIWRTGDRDTSVILGGLASADA
jgi:signal peptidase I